jgi:sugar lactone lactonase YvrE
MRTRLFGRLCVLCAVLLVCARSWAHPGSGIVVDDQGNVFFQDTAAKTIWKIDPAGRLSEYHVGIGGHWMCLDAAGSFARSQPAYFGRITPTGQKPAIIVADGGAPIAVCRDGNLYYGTNPAQGGGGRKDPLSPGALDVVRTTPAGERSLFSPEFPGKLKELDDGITGLAAGPDGSLYVATVTAVLKVKMDGAVSVIAHPIEVPDCDRDSERTPFLRGLCVDADGTVYAAATGCRRVLRISPKGQVQSILKSDKPYSPTGVASRGGEVYVLEYTNANAGPDEGWLPRVRKIARDGKLSTLATIAREAAKAAPAAR